ncbi:anti-sigma regulatory factor (Ser/Thr protein kinase) [Synechococcus sp. PCC 7502]|uniref:ATP-binding protein n=1 Tax=Synechococcus sp. PCC 7502 TaxID=1173263 RepID=UPI00029FBE84|nr:anti-sigma regulatory factor [Synechococcus sp. PCC 7502]AFY72576.1 anti-sigma regulatory factor (Ser/Thr protein kinase) [Synechococcus sp. PCC 7502]
MKTLTLPAHLSSLKSIGQYIMAVCQEAGISSKRAYKLRLSVDELVTNIIVHGCGNSGTESILEIHAEIEPENLKITIADTGLPYDPRERVFDESILSQPIEERPMGGLGVFLSLQSVDEFSYQTTEHKNISSLWLRREQ